MNVNSQEKYFLRPATPEDSQMLNCFLQTENCVLHKHLDWHTPSDWLGKQPFWILGQDNKIYAAVAMPPGPPTVAWIRFFAIAPNLRAKQTWQILFQNARLSFTAPPPNIVSLAIKPQYIELLEESGFHHYQDIINLAWKKHKKNRVDMPSHVKVRPMKPDDLPEVEKLDQLGFEPIWQNSLDVISHAFYQSAHSTVAETNHTIVGYQISTASFSNAHLARIVVHPDYRKQNIAYKLIEELITHFTSYGIENITVNTQHNNIASLSLYHKIGFVETEDRFPVYMFTG
ncbi:MAG: GNAT family N-acetyltransferase [Anaerolineae bacterium]|nr:GNAT family N-acetyltransferase [Anaerolineae bacterium]